MFSIPQSTSFVYVFKAYQSADHVSEATGKTIAITISKAGGAFGNPNAGATNATEISSGWYKVTLDATDTATLGILAVRGTSSGIDDVGDRLYVVSASTGGLTNLDAAVSSRMATYTQPTGFLAATFPTGTIANTTNITAGTITTATNLTNAPTSGDFTAAMKTSLNAATPAVTVSDKTGFKLASDGLAAVTAWTVAITGNITGNLSGSVGSVTGNVGGNVTGSVGSISGVAFPTNFASLGIGSGGHILTVDTLTTYTGNTPQTGDAFALIGTAGAGLTGLGDTRLAHLDADVSSRSTYAGADTSGTTTLLGRLTSTRASLLDNLDAAVSTRSTFAGGAVASVTGSVGSVTGLIASDVGAIKAKTDNLPVSPAAVGSAMTLTVAYDAAKTAAQAGDAMTLTGAYDAAKTAATQTSVDDLPSNAELATALAGADDATLAAIAALPTAVTVNAIKAKTDNLPSDPADQSLVIAATDTIMARIGAPAGASVSADVATVKADTASAKAKTDQMVFTNANELNVNVHSMNDVRLTGTGIENTDEWRPA